MRALPGAGCGLELRFFLRGGWRVSILRRRLAVSDCPYSACRALLAGYAGSFRLSWFLLVSAILLSEFYVLGLSAPCVWAVQKAGVDRVALAMADIDVKAGRRATKFQRRATCSYTCRPKNAKRLGCGAWNCELRELGKCAVLSMPSAHANRLSAGAW